MSCRGNCKNCAEVDCQPCGHDPIGLEGPKGLTPPLDKPVIYDKDGHIIGFVGDENND